MGILYTTTEIKKCLIYLKNQGLQVDTTIPNEKGHIPNLNENGLPERLNQRLRELNLLKLNKDINPPNLTPVKMVFVEERNVNYLMVYYDDFDDGDKIEKYTLRKRK